ncbi:MAG TPA: enoyl-CoA hydratase-related protein [Actinomycetota bacterium]|nr:enoyl-CoA hydratase-related protein [Actinomycetota bacterium]
MSKVRVSSSGPVLVLTITRPQVRNCVDGETATEIGRAIEEFAHDPDHHVMVITGEGDKAFCAGADLRNADTLMRHEFTDRAGPMGFAALDPGKPTIAAINGVCVAGGLELAAWCDFRIADEKATFGALNRRWGVPFLDGGTQRFPRIVGLGNALYLMETGARFDAAAALRMGFVQEVVSAGRSLDRALELAQHIASYPQSSIRSDRHATLGGLGAPLAEGLRIEAVLGREVLDDPQMREGLAAFDEGRRPEPPLAP